MKEINSNHQQNFIRLIFIYIFITIIGLIKTQTYKESNTKTKDKTISTNKNTFNEENIFKRLNKTSIENEAINILNELIYTNQTFTDTNILSLVSGKNWLTASKLIVDFLIEKENPNLNNIEITKNITSIIDNTIEKLGDIRSFLKGKKKNIVRISPVFEWSQDSELVKIRVKFAKNLESPGEKDIQNFKMNCSRTHLKVEGYKEKEDYLIYFYRYLHLYDFIRFMTCKGSKETDGSYIIKMMKNQFTLYWNYLDQPSLDHHNTYTWFDVFEEYDNKVRYTDYREWASGNLYESDLEDYKTGRFEEKQRRINKMNNNMNYLKTKDYENKNFCNSPINKKHCFIPSIHDWNYWLF